MILSWILKKHVLLVKYNTAEKTSQQRLYVIVRLDFDLQFGNMESCEFKHILELNMLRAAKNELKNRPKIYDVQFSLEQNLKIFLHG